MAYYSAVKLTFDIDTEIYGFAIVIDGIWRLIDHVEIVTNGEWKLWDDLEMVASEIWKEAPLS